MIQTNNQKPDFEHDIQRTVCLALILDIRISDIPYIIRYKYPAHSSFSDNEVLEIHFHLSIHATELYTEIGLNSADVHRQYLEAVERGKRGEKYQEYPGTFGLFVHRQKREIKEVSGCGREV